MDQITGGLQSIIANYGMKLLLAIILLIVGLWLIKFIVRLLEKNVQGRFDRTLTSFLMSITKAVLMILLFISIASTMGIEVTSFVAVLGAASFAVGLALQGSLSNFAGGVLLLIFRPFTAGDTIEVAGHKGKVQEIQILYTIMTTFDNKKIMIPNSNISNNSVTNFSAMDKRRVDLTFGIGYDDDFHEAISLLKDLAARHDLILDDPEPIIRVAEHAGSSINIDCKVWVKGPDYWTVFYDMHENVKDAFDEAGIGIPYPQLDIHFDEGTKLC
ncbi:mechanosensitive ion channel family protein [Halanaerobium sp. ST460_2HS_T2]|uniref:mechanosensitive ion channel family protein n=1 Tax=Halanaerobium sp. ST460_2HS_T2 TaxID=2183914 RepID=UPI000DF2DFA7|nr:mechanosensitive ion channel domain-containing protein [Halanaerobium sp. ST460_2HS_T2]RCW61980.1 small conductance mechanosensitive channel [Halanaerobium sp. ST460_2HS_T2]